MLESADAHDFSPILATVTQTMRIMTTIRAVELPCILAVEYFRGFRVIENEFNLSSSNGFCQNVIDARVIKIDVKVIMKDGRHLIHGDGTRCRTVNQ